VILQMLCDKQDKPAENQIYNHLIKQLMSISYNVLSTFSSLSLFVQIMSLPSYVEGYFSDVCVEGGGKTTLQGYLSF